MQKTLPIGECVQLDDIWHDQRTPARRRAPAKRFFRAAAIWLGLREERWFDRVEADPVRTIEGRHLMDALSHRGAV